MLKKSIRSLLLVSLLLAGSLKAVQLEKTDLFVPSRLGDVKVFHNQDGFHVEKDGEIYRVRNCFVDEEIRNISSKKLMQFIGKIKIVEVYGQKVEFERISKKQFKKIAKVESSEEIELDARTAEQFFSALNFSSIGYIAVNQMNDGEYVLRANIRVLGGGPLFGTVVYWGIKTIAYGSVATVVFLTGGSAAAAVGGAAAVSGGVAAAGAGAMAASTGVGGGASFIVAVEGIATYCGAVAGLAPTL